MILQVRFGLFERGIKAFRHCIQPLLRNFVTRPPRSGQARSQRWPSSGGHLHEWHRSMNWGRLLHLAQQDRLGRLGRVERAELCDLRHRQRDANRGRLITWLLHDNWL